MSDSLLLCYKGEEKRIPFAKNYETLKSTFIKEFNEDEKNNFIFSYLDDDEDNCIISEKSTENEIRQTIGYIINVELDNNETMMESTGYTNLNSSTFSSGFLEDETKEKENKSENNPEESKLNNSKKDNNNNSNDETIKKEIEELKKTNTSLIEKINQIFFIINKLS